MTNVSLKISTRECIPDNQFLGYEGENEVNKLIFNFEDGFFDGSALLNVHRGEQKGYVTLDRIDETYELSVKNSLLSQKGDIRFQLSITSTEGKVIKFDPFVMTVKDAIDTDVEMPEEYPSWIDEANAKIAEIDKAIEDAEKLDAKVEQTENGALITITGRDGVTTAEVLHGTGESGGGIVAETDPVYMKDKPNIALKSEIPTNLSQLKNDSRFITEEDIPEPPKVPTKTSELTNDSNFATESYVKNEIANAQLGGEGGEIDLSGYATKDELNGKVDKEAGKSLIDDTEIERLKNVTNYDDTEIKQELDNIDQDISNISQELNNKADSNVIPTKTSQLANDSNFATETYVDEEIAKFDFIKVVDVLPETGLLNRIYFVPKSDTQTQDLFDEYVWVNDKWEWITTKQIEVDLTEYVKREELSTLATKEELANKQDKLDYSIVTLTQAEYDALVSAGTVDDNTYYFIKEEE